MLLKTNQGVNYHFTCCSSFWQNDMLSRIGRKINRSLVQEMHDIMISHEFYRPMISPYLSYVTKLFTHYIIFVSMHMIYNVKRCTCRWEIVVLVVAFWWHFSQHLNINIPQVTHLLIISMLIVYTYTNCQVWTINYSAHTLFCCLGGPRSRDRMVVRFTTTRAISAYRH